MTGGGAAAFALSKVGQGYIYGAKGQTCSGAFRRQQANQYPKQAKSILGTGAKWDGVPFPPQLKRLLGQHLEEEEEDDHGSQP